ncbi:mitogen-activated protein kinase, putative, partial [Bodo saltans]
NQTTANMTGVCLAVMASLPAPSISNGGSNSSDGDDVVGALRRENRRRLEANVRRFFSSIELYISSMKNSSGLKALNTAEKTSMIPFLSEVAVSSGCATYSGFDDRTRLNIQLPSNPPLELISVTYSNANADGSFSRVGPYEYNLTTHANASVIPAVQVETYNPTVRPWYSMPWTFRLSSSGNSSLVTASGPIANATGLKRGVVAMDCSTSALVNYLQAETVGKTGRVFLVGRRSSEFLGGNWAAPAAVNDSGYVRLATLDDVVTSDSLVSRMNSSLGPEYWKNCAAPCSTDIGTGADALYVDVLAITDTYGLDLRLVVLLPAKDFMNDSSTDGNFTGDNGFPSFPNCPALTEENYFQVKPDDESNCLPQLLCERQWCDCNAIPNVTQYKCGFNASLFQMSVFESCGPSYLRCLANASLQLADSSIVNASHHTCAGWAYPFAHDYAEYYASSNKSATRIVQSCVSSICNTEMMLFNQTTANMTGVCLAVMASLPAIRNNNTDGNNGGILQCSNQASKLFDNLPSARCASIESCTKSFCSCVNGSYLGGGDCKLSSSSQTNVSQRCLTAALSCVVNTALSLYVPGTDETSPTADTCARWSVSIARAYKEYFNATNKQATELYGACNATACKLLGDATLLAPTCGFASVTRTPTYQAPNLCLFVCPDTTCSRYLANCSCVLNAAIYNVSAQFPRALSAFDVTNDLTAFGFGTYRVLSGNCSGYDFNPNLRYSWELSNATNDNVYSGNGSALNIPRLSMAPSASYNLTLTVRGLLRDIFSVVSWTVATVTPTPTVSITKNGAALRVSNNNATVLPVVVVDAFPGASPSFSWTCASLTAGVECPVITNNTISRLTIPANSATGNFSITFTYKVVSSSLNLTIVAGTIPTVRIVQTSLPVVTVPALYLPTQTVILASSVTGAGDVTYLWTVNGVNRGTDKSLVANATTLVASTPAQLNDGAPALNVIVLRVSAASDANVYGESTFVVVVAPTYTITLDVKKFDDASATSAIGLTDNLHLTVATNLGSPAPYGLASTFGFTFVADASRPLTAAPTNNANIFTAQAPMPYSSTNGTISVSFGVQLFLGGKVASTSIATFDIVKPDLAAAASAQIAQAAAITDPIAAVSAATNIQTLMQSSNDVTTKQQLAAAVVSLLSNSVKDFSSQSTQQQAAIFQTLSTAVGSTTDTTQLAEMKAKTLTLMTSALSSTSFDPANGAAALGALSSVSVKDSQSVIATLAVKMANDPTQVPGEVRTIEAPGVSIATVKQSASGLAGLSVSDGSASLTIAAGFTLPGASDSDVVSIAQASFNDNPFGTSGGSNPSSKVVSIQFNINDETADVNGLATELAIALTGGSGVCRYWKESTSVWDNYGVRTEVRNGVVTCLTNHLTAFGSFSSSSAASVAFSAAVVLLSYGVHFFV